VRFATVVAGLVVPIARVEKVNLVEDSVTTGPFTTCDNTGEVLPKIKTSHRLRTLR
jgi:hypothetical protein